MNPFKVDFVGETVIRWSPGGKIEKDRDYHPSIYISSEKCLEKIQENLESRKYTVDTETEKWKTSWREGKTEVLKARIDKIEHIKPAARKIRTNTDPGRYRLYNIDFSPQYRYFLEKGLPPEHRELSSTSIEIPRKDISRKNISKIRLNGKRYSSEERKNLEDLKNLLERQDPDILEINNSEIIPLLHRKAEKLGVNLNLGRAAGHSQLAGESNFTSYGIKKHSPARYNVPGRAIIDSSNSFFLAKTGIHGIKDLVKRSWKPVQEASWASIGNILTAIQIRHAMDNHVLVPWKAWRAEMPKKMSKLHRADRGGFIFSPDTGLHRNVVECDFSSLYPNIICQKNISPDVIRCSCHDREDVPGLGYSICDREGYLKKVLQPIIDDRDVIKQKIRETRDKDEKDRLEQKSDALKWILVSCFGYQGFNNAKFGRIECHESINAFARDILLNAKEEFEKSRWEVIHGIIDSIWVKRRQDNEEIQEVCDRITEKESIRLENEGEYDWIMFCPRRKEKGGALNRYFGKKKNGDYKFRGIELRQRSTPPYIKKCQKEMIERFDTTKNPEKVVQLVKKQLKDLENLDINPVKLAVSKRVTKRPEEYTQNTKNKSAAERALKKHSVTYRRGETVRYVVVDDQKKGVGRVRLPEMEDISRYDSSFYRDLLLRACETVLSPLGWSRKDIEKNISGTRTVGIDIFS